MLKVSDENFPLGAPAGFSFGERLVAGVAVKRREFDLSDWLESTNDCIKVNGFYERRSQSDYGVFLLHDASGALLPVVFTEVDIFRGLTRVLRPVVKVREVHVMIVQLERDFLEQKYNRLKKAVVSACIGSVRRMDDPYNVVVDGNQFKAMKDQVAEDIKIARKLDEEIGQ